MKYYLAIDIGASSGRHIIGSGDGKTEEIYRFQTGFCEARGELHNDVGKLFQNVLEGIRTAFLKYPGIESIAIDTWGVDYVLMKGDREILPVYSYRDSRTESVISEVHGKVPFEELYERTGIQFQPFNTLYQLYADKKAGRLDGATDFLMLPEWLSYKLTGIKKHEYTNATTGGFINCHSGEYDLEILGRLGLPLDLFEKPEMPGTYIGMLKDDVSGYVGGQAKVIFCASHDTASAVEGIPMEGNNPYVSSGTWSLLGVKVPCGITDEKSRIANYSNEGGIGYVRYQKNIMGMWVINNLRSELCPDMSFDGIVKECEESGFDAFPDINDTSFFAPKSMCGAFDSWFENSEIKPVSAGDYFRSAYLGLAHGYKDAIAQLEANTGRKYEKLYIVGGGAKNVFLNRLTSEVCGIEVVALPVEATALGNLKIQMEADK